jgi:hypothetical protein
MERPKYFLEMPSLLHIRMLKLASISKIPSKCRPSWVTGGDSSE